MTRNAKTSLVFSVGEEEVPNFRMVERHYFRDQVRKRVAVLSTTDSGQAEIEPKTKAGGYFPLDS